MVNSSNKNEKLLLQLLSKMSKHIYIFSGLNISNKVSFILVKFYILSAQFIQSIVDILNKPLAFFYLQRLVNSSYKLGNYLAT